MTRSTKVLWGCVGLVAVLLIVAVAAGNAAFLLFALPCALIMGGMMWMMMRGARQGPRRR